jgi:hypothetical protein
MLNFALSQIGAERITGIDDGSVNANYCQDFYPPLRMSLLRSHHWNFAEGRVVLASEATPPLFEYAFSYPLPTDCLKLKEYNGSALDTSVLPDGVLVTRFFKIEGRKLLSNDGEVNIVYVRDVTDPNQWDALFFMVITTWLSGLLAGAITKNINRRDALIREAVNLLLPIATAVDGQEGDIRPIRVDDLLWGR